MAIIRCPKGHFYDDEKHAVCPSCQGSGGPRWSFADDRTVSLTDFAQDEVRAVALTAREPEKEKAHGSWDSEKTVAFYGGVRGGFLAGWLVCVGGEERGRDYRIYPGFNRVGRSLSSDVCVQDPLVSQENHCSVVYEEKKGLFYLVPGKGTLTYVNGELAQTALPLSGRDRIRIGGTVLELAVFCEGEHTWKTMENI